MNSIRLATVADAKAILGLDFHGPEQVNEIYNCDLAERGGWIVPCDIASLELLQGECILFPGCDIDTTGNEMDIHWFQKRFPIGAKPGFIRQPVFSGFSQEFTGQKNCIRQKWYLLHKRIPDQRNSTNQVISMHISRRPIQVREKVATLQETEQLPPVIACFFGLFLHYLITGETMYAYDYILCEDVGKNGLRARIGYFHRQQCYFAFSHFPPLTHYLGVAPMIKPLI